MSNKEAFYLDYRLDQRAGINRAPSCRDSSGSAAELGLSRADLLWIGHQMVPALCRADCLWSRLKMPMML
ncbi:hypothetical protein BGX30_007233, partial [Mortierella sp. GBA39]